LIHLCFTKDLFTGTALYESESSRQSQLIMYNQENRPFRSRRGNRFSGNNSSGNNFRRKRSSKPKFQKDIIDFNKYVSKAKPVITIKEEKVETLFTDFPIREDIKQSIKKRNYLHPTPIQDQSIPYILEGKDVIGLASTGTGKTGAFLIPTINKVLNDREEKIFTPVLIIAPTRELALQINKEFFDLTSKEMRLISVCCYGGSNIREQIMKIRKKPSFIIGTPGRLLDLVNRDILKLDIFHTIVLDEVDRMLDMGFIEDIEKIIAGLPKERQSLFFSATVNKRVQTIMDKLLQNPITVQVAANETSENVNQNIIKVGKHDSKFDLLCQELEKDELSKTLIFCQTKMEVDDLTDGLIHKGFKVDSIHGDKPQYKRQKAISNFANSKVNILVATDVAARGIDIKNISHVINYQEPNNYQDYIHRIGRTGRGGKSGEALTFVHI
jgi:ATP-dependent RNA helicase RhlE